MGKMLSNIEAEVIFDLYREQGLELGEAFLAHEVYPGETKASQQMRATVERLGERGILGVSESGYSLIEKSLKAYDRWAERRPISDIDPITGKDTLTKRLSTRKLVCLRIIAVLTLVAGLLLGGCARKPECWTVGVAQYSINVQTGEVVELAPLPKTICK